MKLFLLAILFVVVVQAPSHAQDHSRPVLEVVAAGTADTLAAMAVRIGALESRLAVEVRWRESPAIDASEIVGQHAHAEGTFARVWLDLNHAERAVLFIANADHDRFLVRVVPARGGYGELTRESLATIVESAIDALLAGGQIGVDRVAVVHEIEVQTGARVVVPPAVPPAFVSAEPESPPAPAPKPTQARAPLEPTSQFSAQYRGEALVDSALRHGVQVALSWAGFKRPAWLMLAATAQYFPRFSLGDAQHSVSQRGGGARMVIGATGMLGRFVWQAGWGAGADSMRVVPKVAEQTGLVAAEPFRTTIPVATAFVSGAWRPAAWIELLLGAGCDLDLAGHHFDVASGNMRTPTLTPWRAHPYWLLGIGIPLTRGEGVGR